MTILVGAAVLTVTWCLLLVWVARTAMSRGRSAVAWSLIAGGLGVLGVLAALELGKKMVDDADVDIGMVRAAIASFLPLFGVVLPMAAVAAAVRREPIKISERGSWPVTVMGKGNATIAIEHSTIRIDGAMSRTLTAEQLLKVEADGECVRITLEGEELIAMPMGKPATPAGRRHQSLVLAKRLRAR